MDGKRFVFDLQRFAEVTVTKTEDNNNTTTYKVGEKTITETEEDGSKTYKIGEDTTTYNSLEDAVVAADPSIKFTVTTKDSSDKETTKYYDAADDFNKDNNLKDATAINVYGNVTLQDDITGNDKVTCTITVKKTATLNLGTHKLNIETPDKRSGNSDSGIVINDGATLTVNAGTGGEINYETKKITNSNAEYDNDNNNVSKVGNYIEKTVKGARQVAAIKVGDSTKQEGTTAKLIVNGGKITSNSTAICAGNGTEVTINTGATVESTYSCGIYVGNVNGRTDSTGSTKGNEADNITLNISGGTVRSSEKSSLPAIQVSGTLSTNTTTINITGGTVEYTNRDTKFDTTDNNNKPYGNPDAIYAGGKVDLKISGGTVTSGGTGIELRAGSLEVTGGTITSSATSYSVNSNTGKTSGGQTYGAAIAMSQHTTGKAVITNVSAGEVSGQVALAIENPASTTAGADSTISATITGGTFESKGTGATAIAAKATDSRSKINIDGKVTFIGTVENTVTDANTSTPSITFGDKAEVTVVTVLERDSEGNITKQEEETYDSTSIQFTETWTTNENGTVVNHTETYPVNDEAWNKSKEDPAKKFYYLVANTVTSEGNTTKSKIAGAKAVLAPKKEGTSGAETDSTDILALTTGLTDQASYDEVIALDLNDTLFSSLFGETSTFKTLDASGITQVSTTTGTGADAVTTKTDRLKLNITGNAKIESIVGSEGNDTLTAGSLGSALNGGTGADLLIGGSGPDTFLFSATGNGSDSIQDYTYGTDIVSLGSGIAPATSFDKVSYAGKDYVVSLGSGTGDSLTFKSTGRFVLNFGTDGKDSVSYTENSIVSGEGVTIGSSYYKSKTFNGNSGDNAVFKTIDGSAVVHAIRITGNSNANLITGSKYGGTLLGGDANDTLVATSVGTYLNGGAEADSLVGFTGGGNVFIYTGGDDKIKNYIVSKDLVSVAAGINIADATVTTETEGSSTNLVIGFDTGDSLTFEGGASSTISLKSGRRDYLFSASSIASASDKSITLTAGYTPDDNTPFSEGDAYDTIDAHLVGKAISITGNNNGNYIVGGTSGGSLFGGDGNDTLKGGAGDDIFRYTAGKDVIIGFNEGTNDTDRLSIDDTQIAKAKASSRKLTFTMNNKANTLVFRATDAAPTQISLASDDAAYLTKDGVVSLPSDTSKTKSLKLFSSAKGRIDLNNDSLYSGKGIASVSAADVTKQSVTLVGGSTDATFTFATNNKKRDGFEYNGGKVTINSYESGKDRLNLGDFTISGFEVKAAAEGQTAGDVVISLGSSDQNVISLTGAAGSEMLIHQATNRGNSYSKMVFDETGVVYDKAKTKATSATIWSGMTAGKGYDPTGATKLKKIKVRDDAVTNISIQAGGNNTLIDASLAGAGVSLYSGDKNDKFIGSSEADMFVYTKGKDIIQGFGTGDSISLSSSSGGTELALTDAKITSGKKSIKFKFEGGNKNTLTIKPTKNETLSGALNINGKERIYGKNFIASGTNVSLTSKFGGTYNLDKVNKNASGSYNYVDGHLVEKKLTFKGTDAAESLIGGQNKTTFKGGGGADSLVGGKGADTFFYAKGDKDTVTIANFDFDNDKLKIAGGTINKIESLESGGVQFAMKNGRGDSPAVGWFKVTSSATATSYNNGTLPTSTNINAKDVLIKANNTYYWFAQSETTLASDSLQSAKVGDLITWDKKVSKSDIGSGAAVIELNYSTNLVKAGVASVVSSSSTALPNKS